MTNRRGRIAASGDRAFAASPSGQSSLSRPSGLQSHCAEEAEIAVDLSAREVCREADFLTVAPKHLVAANRDLIEEARERLNDALARIDR